jgi:predicted dehydrogenase
MTRLGVTGLGRLGESIVAHARRIPGLEVVAVHDVQPGRAEEVAERYGIGWSGQVFEDLLTIGGVDAVAICTPNALHVPQAQAALRLGTHVLVQKPLALSFADAQATVDLAARVGTVLFVDYSYRFLETVQRFREVLRRAQHVRSARAVFHNIYGPGAEKTWFFDPALSGGGALIDLGVHLIDMGLSMLEPKQVRLEQARLSPEKPVELSAVIRLLLDEVEFEVSVSWNANRPATEISFEALTDQGSMRWENVNGSFFHFRTLCDNGVLADCETTLREDTLRAFREALASRTAPTIDTRVYSVLDQAYGRAGSTHDFVSHAVQTLL